MRAFFVLASVLLMQAAACAQTVPVFKHVILVVQENRTPDNLFGSNPTFEPGVDIASTGVTSTGATVPLTALPLVECYDIAHTHASFEAALTRGFDQEPLLTTNCTKAPPANAQFKFADNSTGTVQPYFDLALAYGFANRMFQTNQGPSFPAHQFLFGGTSAPSASSALFAAENPLLQGNSGCIAVPAQTVGIIDYAGSETTHAAAYPCFDHNTLADRLDAAKPALSWRYYAPTPGSIWTAPDAVAHICKAKTVSGVLTCTGTDWTKNVVPDNSAQVLTDIAACNLPAMSWAIPTAAESDHADANKGLGPQWVASIVNAVGQQRCASGETYWNDTVIIVVWDDWGGWYDHVKPPSVNIDTASWGSGYTYGFRVPLLVISAFTPGGTVSNAILDFGSILYFIEQNFGLGFIGPGTGTFSRYADYQSSKAPFGTLDSFFTLTMPKPFAVIPTTKSIQDFIDAPKSNAPPDDD
jgi:phospholipase C